ncbi:cysteine hydrolase ['Osedax' symbiont bacterium Rs2_46_30_T18]|nr:cysteine hydrolase ['Osedax' symbiont bacterium Rs2_46_30_T18]
MGLKRKSALIIIDQQQGIDAAKLGPRNNPEAQSIMLKLLAQWRQDKQPVFHIRHRSCEVDSVFWPLQSGFEFKPEFVPALGENSIEKLVPCSFTGSDLLQQLQQLSIASVVIVGASTNNSVESTARTAGNLGLSVIVVEDGCFAFDKADYFARHRSASEVHAMSLANLDGEYAQVLNSKKILNR